MNKMTFILSVMLLLVLTNDLFSQGEYLGRGRNGFGIGAVFSSNKDISGISGEASYSASGIFDFGLSVGRFSSDQKLAGYDLSATTISPFVAIHAIKQDSVTPISVSLYASYGSASYSSDALSQLKWSMSGSYFSFGGLIYGNITLSPTTKLRPYIGVGYATGKSEVEDNYGNSVSSDNNVIDFAVGFALFFQTGPSTLFRIGPRLIFDKDNTTFAIGAGFVFAMSN